MIINITPMQLLRLILFILKVNFYVLFYEKYWRRKIVHRILETD